MHWLSVKEGCGASRTSVRLATLRGIVVPIHVTAALDSRAILAQREGDVGTIAVRARIAEGDCPPLMVLLCPSDFCTGMASNGKYKGGSPCRLVCHLFISANSCCPDDSPKEALDRTVTLPGRCSYLGDSHDGLYAKSSYTSTFPSLSCSPGIQKRCKKIPSHKKRILFWWLKRHMTGFCRDAIY